jgi:type I restriction enzyme S subunit
MSEASPFSTVQLADVVDILDNLRIPINGAERMGRAGTVPYYGANGFQGWIDRPLFDEPLILLAEDGGNFDDFASRPIAYRIDGPAWVNNHAHIIRAKAGVNQSFIFWSIVNKDIRKYIAGGTRTKLTQGELRRIELNLPIEEEQKGIAEVLDTLDTAIHETEAIIAKLKAVKQGLLHDLLTRGVDANGELRPPQAEAPNLYKESPLGWISREWEIESINRACSDVVDCPHSTPNYQDQGVLVARTMHIKDGAFLETLASRVSERQYQDRISRLEPQTGDVIFTREAPVGEAFVIPLDMRICLGQRVMLLRPKNGRLVAEYLLAQIYSGVVKDRIATLTSGTTNPHLNVSEVKEFEIPLPPLVEQQEIAKRLNEHESRLQSEMSEKNKLSLLKTGLMDDLLTGRVRVTSLLAEAEQQQGSA